MRKIIISIFLVLTFLCSPAMSLTAIDWLNKADALIKGDRYTDPKKAIKYLSKAIKLQPDYAKAYYKRGIAYDELRQYQWAIEDYNKAIRLQPDYARAYYNRGVAYLKQGKKMHGCLDTQKACSLGECKALEWAKSKGYCR
jgi:tetratricopeptide (TPR) repeat protein